MALISKSNGYRFSAESIQVGDFILARHQQWDTARNGLVSVVSENELRVLFLPEGMNTTQYFLITADEVAKGLWNIIWTRDMEMIHRHEPEGSAPP